MLLDSNNIIYAGKPHFDTLRKYLAPKFYFCSEISLVETLGYHDFKQDEREILEYFFDGAPLVPVTSKILGTAILLKQAKRMSLGDSIIAATALQWDFPLFTNNEKDFIGIPNLQVIAPSSII